MAYTYKKQINLTGQSGAGTGYQVKLLIGESSGSGTNNVHLAAHAATFPSARNQGGDLKFYANDESTVLDFWVEKVTGSAPNRVATIWVEVQADLGSNQSIWVYYGDAGAANLSNGVNTFSLFDDFDAGSLDAKWTATGTNSISSSILTINAGIDHKIISAASTFGDGLEVVAYMQPCGTDASTSDMVGFGSTEPYFANIYPSFAGNQSFARNNSSWNGLGTRYQGSYYRITCSRKSGTARITVDDVQKYSGAGASTSNSYIQVGRSYEYTYYIDWVFVRKYQTTEPSFGSAGSEQNVVPPVFTKNIIVRQAAKRAAFY